MASHGLVKGLIELAGALLVDWLVEGGVEYLSPRVVLGTSNSESDTSKVGAWTSN